MTYYERNLPHWHPQGKSLFVTWRLSGSLPRHVLEALRNNNSQVTGKQFREFDLQLDKRAFGPTWLEDPRIAPLIVSALRRAEKRRLCALHAFVVMPNHVHVLLEPAAPLPIITKAIKGATARAGNLILGRTGRSFWQDESFDHWIRNAAEFTRVLAYKKPTSNCQAPLGRSALRPPEKTAAGQVHPEASEGKGQKEKVRCLSAT
jgi:putative transposase